MTHLHAGYLASLPESLKSPLADEGISGLGGKGKGPGKASIMGSTAPTVTTRNSPTSLSAVSASGVGTELCESHL
jgi:hypothetical protein